MNLEIPQYANKWKALTWKVIDPFGWKNMVQSQELYALRSLFHDHTPYSFVGQRQIDLLKLIIQTSDVPSHVKMATDALEYYSG